MKISIPVLPSEGQNFHFKYKLVLELNVPDDIPARLFDYLLSIRWHHNITEITPVLVLAFFAPRKIIEKADKAFKDKKNRKISFTLKPTFSGFNLQYHVLNTYIAFGYTIAQEILQHVKVAKVKEADLTRYAVFFVQLVPECYDKLGSKPSQENVYLLKKSDIAGCPLHTSKFKLLSEQIKDLGKVQSKHYPLRRLFIETNYAFLGKPLLKLSDNQQSLQKLGQQVGTYFTFARDISTILPTFVGLGNSSIFAVNLYDILKAEVKAGKPPVKKIGLYTKVQGSANLHLDQNLQKEGYDLLPVDKLQIVAEESPVLTFSQIFCEPKYRFVVSSTVLPVLTLETSVYDIWKLFDPKHISKIKSKMSKSCANAKPVINKFQISLSQKNFFAWQFLYANEYSYLTTRVEASGDFYFLSKLVFEDLPVPRLVPVYNYDTKSKDLKYNFQFLLFATDTVLTRSSIGASPIFLGTVNLLGKTIVPPEFVPAV